MNNQVDQQKYWKLTTLLIIIIKVKKKKGTKSKVFFVHSSLGSLL